MVEYSSSGLGDGSSDSGVCVSGETEIANLLCAYVSESLRITERWAAAHDIHHTDVRAMAALDEASRCGSPMTAGSLAAALGLSSPATSALIARLEGAGHVVRERDPKDRRRVFLRPSPSAHRSSVEYFRPMGEAVSAALASSSDADTSAIADFLEVLVEKMRAISQP